jgi:hypothetical protein
MVSWDPPSLLDDLLVTPLPTRVLPPPTAFHPVGPLILQVSPPPEFPNPKEFYYDPSPDVTQGIFVAAQAFFMAKGHNVETVKCPNLDAFVAASPSVIIHWLFKLPVLVFSKGG